MISTSFLGLRISALPYHYHFDLVSFMLPLFLLYFVMPPCLHFAINVHHLHPVEIIDMSCHWYGLFGLSILGKFT